MRNQWHVTKNGIMKFALIAALAFIAGAAVQIGALWVALAAVVVVIVLLSERDWE